MCNDRAGNMVRKTVRGKTTTFLFDGANQLVSSTCDGVTTHYAYDAAGRLAREGDRTYCYGYLDKVLSVTEGGRRYAYDYHADGQLAKADYGDGRSETFAWDGLALIRRGDERFVNEPHVGGGNPVASSKGTTYFNDVLGHAFLFRNYRASLVKWQAADPLGYPDGWNQLAYCGNGVLESVNLFGTVIFGIYDYIRRGRRISSVGDIPIVRTSRNDGEGECCVLEERGE